MSIPRVVIASGPCTRISALVAEHSIRKYTKDVEIIHTWDKDRPTAFGHPVPDKMPLTDANRKENYPDPPKADPTEFSFVRLWVPELCGKSGKAIYMDSDQILMADITEMWNLSMGQHAVLQFRDTSVLLIDCEKCAGWNAWDVALRCKKRNAYGPEIMTLDNEPRIGMGPQEWNMPDRYDSNTKLLHYTKRQTQPGMTMPGSHRFEAPWYQLLGECVEQGIVKAEELNVCMKAGLEKYCE